MKLCLKKKSFFDKFELLYHLNINELLYLVYFFAMFIFQDYDFRRFTQSPFKLYNDRPKIRKQTKYKAEFVIRPKIFMVDFNHQAEYIKLNLLWDLLCPRALNSARWWPFLLDLFLTNYEKITLNRLIFTIFWTLIGPFFKFTS